METPSRIVLAADHAGHPLKEVVKTYLTEKGIDIVDVQPDLVAGDDYPEIMRKGCSAMLEYNCFGIVFGGSGNGEAIACNKVEGIRCALVYSEDTARLARAHNDANAISFGGRLTDEKTALACVDIFLETEFEGGRHEKRVNDIE